MKHDVARIRAVMALAGRMRALTIAMAMALAMAMSMTGGQVLAQVSRQICGPLKPSPWDYRKVKQFYALVENAHFTPQVEGLIRGQSGSLPGPDIEYTLSVYPNHPRAILAATRLSERDQTQNRNRLPRPVECYYEMALRFAPDDAVIRMLYARFLAARQRKSEAISEVQAALQLSDGNPLTQRNAGLVYIEMKEFQRARELAYVLQRSYPNEDVLRKALVGANEWREAPAVSEAAASAASEPK